METILDAAIQYVEKPAELRKWIHSWLQAIGCSPRLRSKYSIETRPSLNDHSNSNSNSNSNSTNDAPTFSCSIEHSMHVLYDRFLHPSTIGSDVSLIDDINETLQMDCSCSGSIHFACFSVLFLMKRKLEQSETLISDWLDYVLKCPEKQAVQMMKLNDYFRSDNKQIQKEDNWMNTLRFAIPLIIPILSISEVCFLRKRLFSRLRKIGCQIELQSS